MAEVVNFMLYVLNHNFKNRKKVPTSKFCQIIKICFLSQFEENASV